jgi:dipeptidyl aminopeptidase/acylaminoacyl peptidase
MFLRSLLVGALSALLFVGLAIGVVAWYMVDTLIRPKKTNAFARETISPFELGLPIENVTFGSRTGHHQVSGWYLTAPGATATILVCPGYRTRKTQVLAVVNFLWRAGFSVLAFEYYGHGDVGGVPVTLGYREREDFLSALAYARMRAPENRIGVLAYSMGAAIALLCGADHPEIEAIVADSAFASHRSAVSYNLRRTLHLPAAPFLWVGDWLLLVRAGYRFHQVEPLRAIAHIAPRPLLLIHGSRDQMVDPRDAGLLYRAAQGHKQLWMVPQADHCGAYFADRERYIRRIVTFFDTHLTGSHSTDAEETPPGSGSFLDTCLPPQPVEPQKNADCLPGEKPDAPEAL